MAAAYVTVIKGWPWSNVRQHDYQKQNASCLGSLARRDSKHQNPVGRASKTITTWPKQTGTETGLLQRTLISPWMWQRKRVNQLSSHVRTSSSHRDACLCPFPRARLPCPPFGLANGSWAEDHAVVVGEDHAVVVGLDLFSSPLQEKIRGLQISSFQRERPVRNLAVLYSPSPDRRLPPLVSPRPPPDPSGADKPPDGQTSLTSLPF